MENWRNFEFHQENKGRKSELENDKRRIGRFG